MISKTIDKSELKLDNLGGQRTPNELSHDNNQRKSRRPIQYSRNGEAEGAYRPRGVAV